MLSLCVYYHLYATTPSYLSLSLSLSNDYFLNTS